MDGRETDPRGRYVVYVDEDGYRRPIAEWLTLHERWQEGGFCLLDEAVARRWAAADAKWERYGREHSEIDGTLHRVHPAP